MKTPILVAIIPLHDSVPLDDLEEDKKMHGTTLPAGATGFGAYKLAHFPVAQKPSFARPIAHIVDAATEGARSNA